MRNHFLRYFYLFSLAATCLQAHIPTQPETLRYREQLDALTLTPPTCLSIPEGAFVYCHHPLVEGWLEKKLSARLLQDIESHLQPFLDIPFTQEGFTQAVAKPEGDAFGQVSYSAIWVRDCCWHYYGLKVHNPEGAKRLILSLLRFYASEGQIARFLSVIENPQIADPSVDPMAHMNVPLIRFSSKTLSHHSQDNQIQEWNHLQFDSHGLFLLALSDALSSGILTPEDLTQEHYTVLALFPAFFTQTQYAEKADAGPWEERLQHNASSAGLVAAGITRIMNVVHAKPALEQGMQQAIAFLTAQGAREACISKITAALSCENIDTLHRCGLERVERNLQLGGEAPDIYGEGIDRRADAALLFLCLVEGTPFFDQPQKTREILKINASLIGPYGIYRYLHDPYQACNYWTYFDVSSPIKGAHTPLFETLNWWKKGYMPHRQPYDAQWFFDSCFADLYYHLSMLEQEKPAKAYYLKQGDIHLKRALGQLTGPKAYAANGQPLSALELPESMNTVLDSSNNAHPLSSPICPLSWAKAAMQMALARAIDAHAEYENK